MANDKQLLLTFDYVNHRNESSRRRVLMSATMIRAIPILPWYPEPTFTIRGYDVDRKDFRDFQLVKMTNMKEEQY